ncbi:MAG TPA: hypothetical protein VF254_06380 [Gammaproteobacteria bacterium]
MGQRNSERQGGKAAQPKKEAAPGRQGQQAKPRQGSQGSQRRSTQ